MTITQKYSNCKSKTAVITTNFAPTVAGNCFHKHLGWSYFDNQSDWKLISNYCYCFDSTDWSGKVTPGYLNLAVGCGLSGGATVLSGVEYGIVSGVSIDGSTLNITQPCSSTSCKDPGNGKSFLVITLICALW